MTARRPCPRVLLALLAALLTSIGWFAVRPVPALAALDPSGYIALSRYGVGIETYVAATGSKVGTVPVASGRTPALSPDGRRVAFVDDVPGAGLEVFVSAVDGSATTRLTSNSLVDVEPSWSPDGRNLAWTQRDGAGHGDVYVMKADGTEAARAVASDSSSDDRDPSWSPSGTQIAFLSDRGDVGCIYPNRTPTQIWRQSRVYTVASDGSSSPVELMPRDSGYIHWNVDWSNAGIAVSRQHDNLTHSSAPGETCSFIPSDLEKDVTIVGADGTRIKSIPRPLDASDLNVAWSPLGTELLANDGGAHLVAYGTDGSVRTVLSQVSTDSSVTFDWSSQSGSEVLTPPTAAPRVTVTRVKSGGYDVTWTAVAGASGYRVYTEAPVAVNEGEWGYRVTGSERRLMVTLPSSSTGVRAPDVLSSEVNLISFSGEFAVVAFNSAGTGPTGTARAGCAAAYFVSARGSGQNPSASGDNGYASGLGSRGAHVYEDLRARLGLSRSQFQANAVNYPANPIQWKLVLSPNSQYWPSERSGAYTTLNQLETISSRCPASRIFVFGYSQGAHAVGDAFEASTATAKSRITSVQLFADAARNEKDLGILQLPSAASQSGIMGRRAYFHPTSTQQVMSWCYSRDDVCSKDSIPLTFHGDQYDCYEKNAALKMALVARNVGLVSSPNLTRPTCTLVS